MLPTCRPPGLRGRQLHWSCSRCKRTSGSKLSNWEHRSIGMVTTSAMQSRWAGVEDTHTYTHTCSVIHLLQRERVQTSKAMSALSDSIKLVQREGEASRRHLSDVLHAEVTIRYSLPCCVLQVSCCWNQPPVWCGVVWCGVVCVLQAARA